MTLDGMLRPLLSSSRGVVAAKALPCLFGFLRVGRWVIPENGGGGGGATFGKSFFFY